MPLRNKKTKRSHKSHKSHKSILRKGKRRNRTRRIRRVRFLGGMVGPRWMDTNLGPMKMEEYDQYQQRLSPEAY